MVGLNKTYPNGKQVLKDIYLSFYYGAKIGILGLNGSGKSTLIEALTCYVVAEDPGPLLLTAQTDADIGDWAESRLWPVLRGTEPTATLMPVDRSKIRKTPL